MENKSDEQLTIIQATSEAKKQVSDEKMTKLTEEFKRMIAAITDLINNLKSSPYHRDSPKSQYPTTIFPAKRRAPPLHSGQYTKIGVMWTLKHEISSQIFYELLIKK